MRVFSRPGGQPRNPRLPDTLSRPCPCYINGLACAIHPYPSSRPSRLHLVARMNAPFIECSHIMQWYQCTSISMHGLSIHQPTLRHHRPSRPIRLRANALAVQRV
jgi:hypothetical protein